MGAGSTGNVTSQNELFSPYSMQSFKCLLQECHNQHIKVTSLMLFLFVFYSQYDHYCQTFLYCVNNYSFYVFWLLLKRHNSVKKYSLQEAAAILVHSFFTCRIDYCSSLLYGLPHYQLQRVQNLAARLVYRESKFCHITPLLKKLHWLPITYRIRFKIAL